jgi:hypothetical protein
MVGFGVALYRLEPGCGLINLRLDIYCLLSKNRSFEGRQELLSVHVTGKNQFENCETYDHLSLSPFVRIQ